jgi:aldehyde:ferredoxin oxidoreductase
MIRDDFRVLHVNLTTGKGAVISFSSKLEWIGGSGLAAGLFQKFGKHDAPWDDPEQPIIFAIGPLTGYFPLMSKTVAAFKSPYHDQYAESHAGGRSALSLRFADLDALVITGKAPVLSSLSVGNQQLDIQDVKFLRGKDVQTTGRYIRRLNRGHGGHRSILRIGPAAENGCAYACINADTYRHFGRLGGGSAMGAKNLKAIHIAGDGSFKLPEGKAYSKLFKDIYDKATATDMMEKYHNLGTAVNMKVLDGIQSLPWRNLQDTAEPEHIDNISGERFADDALLRNAACSGCPVGCIHIGFVREKFREDNQYTYRQVSYDYELIYANGSMLGMNNAFQVLDIIDVEEKLGLDTMSAGVALAWATEALDKGVITQDETLAPLRFGEMHPYMQALEHIANPPNDFYRLLAKGTMHAAREYGGEDMACVLGQEMAGYATGEVFYVAESLGFRHSHLDTGGYSFDQKHQEQDVDKAVNFLIQDETERVMLTSMVSCLFARKVYEDEVVQEALKTLGYEELADTLDDAAEQVRCKRWAERFKTGYDPDSYTIPKRFREVVTWKGQTDPEYLENLRKTYAGRLKGLVEGLTGE